MARHPYSPLSACIPFVHSCLPLPKGGCLVHFGNFHEKEIKHSNLPNRASTGM